MIQKNFSQKIIQALYVFVPVFTISIVNALAMGYNIDQFFSSMSTALNVTLCFIYYYYLLDLRNSLLPEVFKRKQKKIAFIAFLFSTIIAFTFELVKTNFLHKELIWSKLILYSLGYAILTVIFVNAFLKLTSFIKSK